MFSVPPVLPVLLPAAGAAPPDEPSPATHPVRARAAEAAMAAAPRSERRVMGREYGMVFLLGTGRGISGGASPSAGKSDGTRLRGCFILLCPGCATGGRL